MSDSDIGAGAGPGRRIGEVAQLTGVTPRTLRYYEELGLITPGARAVPTQGRRYSEAEVARVRRIKEMQQFLGADLGEIRDLLAAEARLEELQVTNWRGTSPSVQAAALTAAAAAVERLLVQVGERQARLATLQGELEQRRASHLALLSALLPTGAT
jgi:DNA-binding transcriptional MerR regulator